MTPKQARIGGAAAVALVVAFGIAACQATEPTAANEAGSHHRVERGPWCGAYCALAALRSIGRQATIEKLLSSRYVGSFSGSTAEELCAAITDHGAFAKALKGLTVASLRRSRCPLILHVASTRAGRWYDHWVLYSGVEDAGAVILDFPHRPERYSFADLSSIWDGTAVAVANAEGPVEELVLDDRLDLAARLMAILGALTIVIHMARNAWRRFRTAPNLSGLATFPFQPLILVVVAALAAAAFHAVSAHGFLRNPRVVQGVCLATNPPEFASVNAAEVAARASEPGCAIVDARFSRDFEAGHVDGAISLPIDSSIPERQRAANALRGKRLVIVYCQSESCAFARSIASDLTAEGVKDIAIYHDGCVEWSKRLSDKAVDAGRSTNAPGGLP